MGEGLQLVYNVDQLIDCQTMSLFSRGFRVCVCVCGGGGELGKTLQHISWCTMCLGIDKKCSTDFEKYRVNVTYIFTWLCAVCNTIGNRPTEKELETPQIYPGIDVTTRNRSVLRLYGEIVLPAQHILKSCELVKQCAKLVRLSRHYFSRDL